MPRFFILLPALLLGACSYHTSRSSIVVVTDAKSVVENCAALGQVDGQDSSQAMMPLDKTRDSVVARLKIAGAEKSGLLTVLPRHRVTALTTHDGAVVGAQGDILASSAAARGAQSGREPVGAFEITAGATIVSFMRGDAPPADELALTAANANSTTAMIPTITPEILRRNFASSRLPRCSRGRAR